MAVPVTQDLYDTLSSLRDAFAQQRDISLGAAAAAQHDADLYGSRVELLAGVLADLTVPGTPPVVEPSPGA